MAHTARPPVEAVIILGAVGAGCMYAAYVGSHTLLGHNDVALNRRNRFQFLSNENNNLLSRPFALTKWKNMLSIKDENDDTKL